MFDKKFDLLLLLLNSSLGPQNTSQSNMGSKINYILSTCLYIEGPFGWFGACHAYGQGDGI